MKFIVMIAVLVSTQLAAAETLREKKTKEEMLVRVESLIAKAELGREALDNEDVEGACAVISELFKTLPDHLVSIGTKMNLLDSKVLKMENETKMFLIRMHQNANICSSSSIVGENLELKETDKELKKLVKALKSQRKKIKKSKTGFENTYNYFYEF